MATVDTEFIWKREDVLDLYSQPDDPYYPQVCLDEVFLPLATVIRVVLDRLNPHTPAALYQTFSPEEARRILRKLEFHSTPKHGSWLKMVEIELSVLSRQCLNRRIPNQERMKQEVAAWEQVRNAQKATVNWRFTNSDARIKLERLYPPLNLS
jgi:DDE superfamily endonuclease